MADFDLAAMQRAVAQCDLNVKVFEDAIARERTTKAEYQRIIHSLENAVGPSVKVEVVREDLTSGTGY